MSIYIDKESLIEEGKAPCIITEQEMYWVRLSHRFHGISCGTLGWLQCFLRLVLYWVWVSTHTLDYCNELSVGQGQLQWAPLSQKASKPLQRFSEQGFVKFLTVTPTHGRRSTDLLTLGLFEMVTNFRSCLDYVPVCSMMLTEGVGIFNVMFNAIKWKLTEQTSPINSPCLPIVGSECRYYCFIHPYPTSTQMKSVDNSELWTYLPWSAHDAQDSKTVSLVSIKKVIIN